MCALLCHNLSIGFLTGIQLHHMAYAPDPQDKHRHNRVQEELSSLCDILAAIEDESEDEYVNPLPLPRTILHLRDILDEVVCRNPTYVKLAEHWLSRLDVGTQTPPIDPELYKAHCNIIQLARHSPLHDIIHQLSTVSTQDPEAKWLVVEFQHHMNHEHLEVQKLWACFC